MSSNFSKGGLTPFDPLDITTDIRPLVMKETATTTASALIAIFKKSIDTGEVPED